ncbi:MAG: YbhB/YbcL family Raf kinase inhibitor-like protein [Bifidobacteriaceae bacterium]|nr:YbhB/YbcL family Raf kinase inhibitor-like protein [Bifidobacteriaceae bacterium]
MVKRARATGLAVAVIVGLVVGLGGPLGTGVASASKAMSVTSPGIKKGWIADAYGARGTVKGGVPVVSLPLQVSGAPAKTVAYAVLVTDPDARAVAGIEFRHWMAANILTPKITRNASVKQAKKMVQGVNDYGTFGYGGPNPPDKTHTYSITVYALKEKVKLTQGFDLSITEFKAALGRSVLASKTIRGKYSPSR